MSLFSRGPEKPGYREQSARPHTSATQAVPTITPPVQKIVEPSSLVVASLDCGSKISGKLHFEGSLRIEGNIDGEIDSKEITIGESAVVTAQIRADSIVVCGKVEGEITATQRIEIRATAKITGNIAAPKLIIHEGAFFEGRCSTRRESEGDHRVPRLFVSES